MTSAAKQSKQKLAAPPAEPAAFFCDVCRKSEWKLLESFLTHVVEKHGQQIIDCDRCQQRFTCESLRLSHMAEKHFAYCCFSCRNVFDERVQVQTHNCLSQVAHWDCDYFSCEDLLFDSELEFLRHLCVSHKLSSVKTLLAKLQKLQRKITVKNEFTGFCLEDDKFILNIPEHLKCIIEFKNLKSRDQISDFESFARQMRKLRPANSFINRKSVANLTALNNEENFCGTANVQSRTSEAGNASHNKDSSLNTTENTESKIPQTDSIFFCTAPKEKNDLVETSLANSEFLSESKPKNHKQAKQNPSKKKISKVEKSKKENLSTQKKDKGKLPAKKSSGKPSSRPKVKPSRKQKKF